jgi:GR25 family glycosyltransferase involved in LPS biosynthesis
MIPAYLINLDREIERLNSSLAESRDLLCEIIRVSAVDLKTLPDASDLFVSAGVRAAWLSHMKCFKLFLESGHPFALILEDDFSIKNIAMFNNELKKVLGSSADVVQLGFLRPGLDTRVKITISNVEERVFRTILFISRLLKLKSSSRLRLKRLADAPKGYVIDDFQPGAHCYVVSRRAAEIVLELNEPQFLSIDDFFTAFARMRSLRFLRIKWSISGQKPFPAWKGDRFRSV